MPSADRPVVHARRVDDGSEPRVLADPGVLEGYLEDASGMPPGRAGGLVRPDSEAQASAFLRASDGPVLFQAARTSLTGGAVPLGETVLSVERLTSIGPVRGGRVRVEPGVRLEALQQSLAREGFYYPPVPTYQRAMIGGAVSTNAGGAASFKYGVTRQWVRGLRVLLFNGDLLEIERGQAVARPGQTIGVRLADGRVLEVPVPDYRLPELKKISAGYHAADPLDLVDLFIGAEGTLGLITAVTLDLVPLPPGVVTGLVFLSDSHAALSLTGELREAARRARGGDEDEPDVRAIEWLDEHCLGMLRRAGVTSHLRVPIPEEARAGLLFETELRHPVSDERAASALIDPPGEPPAGERPLVRLGSILGRYGALDDLQVALPGDEPRRAALNEFREAAPTRFNEELARRRAGRPGVAKVGGDLIVPFDRLEEMLDVYREGFGRRGLEHAIWGHVSDGNLHPNAIPRDADQTRLGFEALLEFADEAARRGGCPLSEHGVGRNPVKQEILRRFLGLGAIGMMRRIKRALDPGLRFAPGVLFPRA